MTKKKTIWSEYPTDDDLDPLEVEGEEDEDDEEEEDLPSPEYTNYPNAGPL